MTRACLIALLLCLGGWRASADEVDVKKLKQQRVEALVKARAASIANWKAGRAGFTPIVVVERELIAARLQMAGNDQERAQALERQLELARTLEKAARDALKGGLTNQLPVHLAEAIRLQYEIDLAALKGKK